MPALRSTLPQGGLLTSLARKPVKTSMTSIARQSSPTSEKGALR